MGSVGWGWWGISPSKLWSGKWNEVCGIDFWDPQQPQSKATVTQVELCGSCVLAGTEGGGEVLAGGGLETGGTGRCPQVERRVRAYLKDPVRCIASLCHGNQYANGNKC